MLNKDNTSEFFEFNGEQWQVERNRRSYRDRQSKPRIYVSDVVDYDETETHAAIEKAAADAGCESIYTRRGDFPTIDKAFDVHNRFIVQTKKDVIDAAIAANALTPFEVQFSRFAGCSCGCSPGFIAKTGFKGSIDFYIYRVREDDDKKEHAQTIEDATTACATL